MDTINNLINWLKENEDVLQYGEIQITIKKHDGNVTAVSKAVTESISYKKSKEKVE